MDTPHNSVHKYKFDRPEVWEAIKERWYAKEADFLTQLLKESSAKDILDVGCGTGGHLALLAEQGFAGTGTDLNEHMVAYCQEKYPALHFAVRDMRALDYAAEFDALLCLGSTFAYNALNQDIVQTLHSFWSALRSGGTLVLEIGNPISLIASHGFKESEEDRVNYPQFGLWSKTTNTIDENAQLMCDETAVYNLKDDSLVQADTTGFRMFFPQELRYFLETCGFANVTLYGAFDRQRTVLDGSKIVAVAHKE
jgi:SAM-dependent methyltransferase